MNQNPNALELISLQHELTMAIGSELCLKNMLQHFLAVCLRRLVLRYVHVYLHKKQDHPIFLTETDTWVVQHYLTIPAAIKQFPHDYPEVQQYLSQPIVKYTTVCCTAEKIYYQLFGLNNLGVLIFERRYKPLEPAICSALLPIIKRLNDSCYASIRHTLLQIEVKERKSIELELKQAKNIAIEAQKKAEQVSITKSRFIANMSHELRTPLNAIIGYSDLLMEEASDSSDKEFVNDLGKIHHAGSHLLDLINDILDISKIEAGKIDFYAELFDLKEVIDNITHTVYPLVQKNDNILTVEFTTKNLDVL